MGDRPFLHYSPSEGSINILRFGDAISSKPKLLLHPILIHQFVDVKTTPLVSLSHSPRPRQAPVSPAAAPAKDRPALQTPVAQARLHTSIRGCGHYDTFHFFQFFRLFLRKKKFNTAQTWN